MENMLVFVVSDVQPGSPQLKGQVSRWHWVGEGHITYLFLGGGQFIEGKFRNVNKASKSVSFAFKHPDSVPDIKPGESIPYLDGSWGERALIVLDESLNGKEITFGPRDAIKTFHDGRTEEIPGGWDHEHCAICWATISQKGNQVFMKSSQDDCLCLDCFRNHVNAKNIDFIEAA